MANKISNEVFYNKDNLIRRLERIRNVASVVVSDDKKTIYLLKNKGINAPNYKIVGQLSCEFVTINTIEFVKLKDQFEILQLGAQTATDFEKPDYLLGED